MLIAIVKNNTIVSFGEDTELFPNVSFPVTGADEVFKTENSIVDVVSWEEFNPSLETIEVVPPYLKNNKVYTCLKRDKTADELASDVQTIKLSKENEIRNLRNQYLKDSDWTQVADAPVDKTAWATYRQALRDITSQEGFPFNVTFPNPPL